MLKFGRFARQTTCPFGAALSQGRTKMEPIEMLTVPPNSPLPSRPTSWSSSPTTGPSDGSPPMRRRTLPRKGKNGRTSENGRLRSPPSSREWKVTRVLSSRTPLLIMPSRPSSPRRLTTRARLWLCSTRSSFRVSRHPFLLSDVSLHGHVAF